MNKDNILVSNASYYRFDWICNDNTVMNVECSIYHSCSIVPAYKSIFPPKKDEDTYVITVRGFKNDQIAMEFPWLEIRKNDYSLLNACVVAGDIVSLATITKNIVKDSVSHEPEQRF